MYSNSILPFCQSNCTSVGLTHWMTNFDYFYQIITTIHVYCGGVNPCEGQGHHASDQELMVAALTKQQYTHDANIFKVSCSLADANSCLIFTQGQFWPSGIVIACVSVCVSVRVWLCVCVCQCVNHLLVRTITRDPFKLGSPNLDQRCKRPWLRSPLFWGVIDPELQGQIQLRSQNLPHFELFHTITHCPFKPGSPNLDQRWKIAWLRSLLFWVAIDLDLLGQIWFKKSNFLVSPLLEIHNHHLTTTE